MPHNAKNSIILCGENSAPAVEQSIRLNEGLTLGKDADPGELYLSMRFSADGQEPATVVGGIWDFLTSQDTAFRGSFEGLIEAEKLKVFTRPYGSLPEVLEAEGLVQIFPP